MWKTRTKEAVRVPGADRVSSRGHQSVADCRQEAVQRLLGFPRPEMKVKTKTLASAVERTRRQAAGAFVRGRGSLRWVWVCRRLGTPGRTGSEPWEWLGSLPQLEPQEEEASGGEMAKPVRGRQQPG